MLCVTQICWYFPLTWQQFRVAGSAIAVAKSGLLGDTQLTPHLLASLAHQDHRGNGDSDGDADSPGAQVPATTLAGSAGASDAIAGAATSATSASVLTVPVEPAATGGADPPADENPAISVDDLFKVGSNATAL